MTFIRALVVIHSRFTSFSRDQILFCQDKDVVSTESTSRDKLTMLTTVEFLDIDSFESESNS
jgi:hypothetical protein